MTRLAIARASARGLRPGRAARPVSPHPAPRAVAAGPTLSSGPAAPGGPAGSPPRGPGMGG
jgi:hypothetical protein